ncbi:MAG: 2OG-Fe(II) oxygenase [Caulobacteraceae bacterium]|nr:2OG-Fe(II) oxygenase [Caulobacteraceae bacterium]
MPAADLKRVLQPVPSWLTLNPALEPLALAQRFAERGRIHVRNLLTRDAANRIHASLSKEGRWARSTIFRGEPGDFDLEVLRALAPGEAAARRADLAERARSGFQYEFDNYRLSAAMLAGDRSGWVYESVFDFVNGPDFLGFVRVVTGDDRIVFADAQATRYRAGHFLTTHDDDKPGQDRLFAFVLNFTPVWRPDWGGLLAFIDADGHIEEAWKPTFNALNIFRVPTSHAVTEVASYVQAERLSITGWLRSRADPVTAP